MSEEEAEIITLTDEDGNDVDFEFLDIIEYQGEEYILLLPLEESDDMDGVVILKIEPTEDEDVDNFAGIEDENVLNAVFEIFKEKYKDEFNFE
ncbi:MAG: DUF1292 domain-containing protein [Eubacterium sp.]|nr:DUF1292 domain-containing protein [Eubacterium sp.]